MIHNKPISTITKDDIQQLLVAAVRENRVIEYKKILSVNSDAEKKEFLADVASFANAGGGDILYGVEAKDGVPTDIPGLADFNEDKERLRLEGSMRDAIDPRIPSVQIHAVSGFATGPVLIVRIPRSWAAPHVVTFKDWQRFFTRNSAGKYQMDLRELRTAFEGSGQLGDRIRRWRDERLGRIMANEGPVRMRGTGHVVIHVVPLDSFGDEFKLSFDHVKDAPTLLPPPGSSSWDYRFNFDGFLTFSSTSEANESRAYSQFFRSGRIEAVCKLFDYTEDGKNVLASIWYEETIMDTLRKALIGLEKVGVTSPVIFMLSLTGIKNAVMSRDTRRLYHYEPHPCREDHLVLPDVLIEDFQCDLNDKLRPVFDMVWNTFGYPRSMNYDDQGRRVVG